MARKTRRRPAKQEQLKLVPGDYQFPGEKNGYWVAMGVTIGLFVWLAFMVWVLREQMFAHHQRDTLPVVGLPKGPAWWMLNLLVYPWLAILFANLLATRHSAADIKKAGRQAKVMSNNYPDLYRLLNTQVRISGMKLPNMYLLRSEAPYIYTIPGGRGTIVLSSGLQEAPDGSPCPPAGSAHHDMPHHRRPPGVEARLCGYPARQATYRNVRVYSVSSYVRIRASTGLPGPFLMSFQAVHQRRIECSSERI
jgi:hypothetical protein